MNLKTEITKIHYEKNPKGFIFGCLSFASMFYSLIINLRDFLFKKGVIKTSKVNAYVISVGNLTTGGVGKTPVVAEFARYFINQNKKVAVISRGYGGKLSNKNINVISDGENIFFDAKMAGDEPFWYTQEIKGLVVVTCKDRVKAANYVIENFGVTHIILDDAFQYRKIERDLNLILIDSEKQLGNEQLLPAGPLREPISQLKRADRVIIVNKSMDNKNAQIYAREFNNARIAYFKPTKIYNIKTEETFNKNSEAVAMCAIGQPQQFFDFLDDCNIKKTIVFDDHHKYEKKDISNITENIITTEKDAVKLKEFDYNNIFALKLGVKMDIESILNDK